MSTNVFITSVCLERKHLWWWYGLYYLTLIMLSAGGSRVAGNTEIIMLCCVNFMHLKKGFYIKICTKIDYWFVNLVVYEARYEILAEDS